MFLIRHVNTMADALWLIALGICAAVGVLAVYAAFFVLPAVFAAGALMCK